MRKAYGSALLVLVLAGCASMFIQGGALVDKGYNPQKVLVSYKAEGTVPQGVEYQLVQTDKGEALFERSADGSGVLFLNRWQDEKGDHFAGWVSRSHGYEYLVPRDRSAKGQKFVYPAGFYTIKEIGGIERPVPVVQVDPVAVLVPRL